MDKSKSRLTIDESIALISGLGFIISIGCVLCGLIADLFKHSLKHAIFYLKQLLVCVPFLIVLLVVIAVIRRKIK